MKTALKIAPRLLLSPLIVALAIILTACESKWAKMSDDELAVKNSDCYGIEDPGAAMIQACKNYQRECERRRENKIYVC
ncbi:MAG: hypothetical protein ACJAYG_000842 [Oceanicoccus sp.]|jgi:hypothetical protein